MQKTKEAIKYGLSTMDITPKEMLSLIESSNGYNGDDNKRWLTSQIIKIAEKDGVGYSQLLAKWFNIISSIEEESSDMTFKDIWVSKIRSMIEGSAVYTIGMGEDNDFGEPLDDVEWFDGVDITWNTWFTDEKLPGDLSKALHSGDKISFIVNLDAKLKASHSGSLVQDAKSNGVQCTNIGALLLYRMCNMLSAMDYPDNFRVIFVSDTSFFLNKENNSVLKYFLNSYSYEGFVINSKDLYNSAFTSEDFAILSCEPRFGAVQDGIVLPRAEGDKLSNTFRRYSVGGNMWQKIFNDDNFGDIVDVISVEKSLELGDSDRDIVPGYVNALGYICKEDSSRVATLSTLPVKGTKYAPITKRNISDIIVYYGVTEALHNAGLPCDISEMLSGHPEYDALVSNCVPVFLFGINSNFRDYGSKMKNAFDIEGSELVHTMIDRASQYFGYETKELMEVCKGFLDYIEHSGESMVGKTFAEIRAKADNEDLNKAYISALSRCLDYISTQYRRM